MDHMSQRRMTKAKKQRVDWVKRDDEIVVEVQQVAAEIKNSSKPQRVTKSSIGRYIQKLSLIQKHLNKLPKVQAALTELTESVEEFRQRKCKSNSYDEDYLI